VRFGFVAFTLVAAVLSARAEIGVQSNPAFLGVGMDLSRHIRGCLIQSVTPDGPAMHAGVQTEDMIVRLDGGDIASCAELSEAIVAHQPGEVIQVELWRRGETVTVQPMLTTRAELLSKHFVGRALESVDVHELDDGRAYDLADDVVGHTTVLGWFDQAHCTDCPAALRKVTTKLAARARAVRIRAVTSGDVDELQKSTPVVGAPIVVASGTVFDHATIADVDRRVVFMVVDCRGVVRFVVPIAADGDDTAATIDELLAAVQQAEHARFKR
jgi:hypothetical protein